MIAHHIKESVEDVFAVEGAGRRLGVVLDRHDGQRPVADALYGAVVQVDVAYLDLRGQAVGVDGVAVVLGGDVDAAGREVPDWVVGAAVAEFQLEGLGAEGAGEDLVA